MNKPKIAGTRFERAVCDFLKPWFPDVDRACLRGNLDRGDLIGIPDTTCELKAEKRLDATTALKEAQAASVKAGTRWAVAILKRPRKGTGEALVVMTLEQWARLVAGDRP